MRLVGMVEKDVVLGVKLKETENLDVDKCVFNGSNEFFTQITFKKNSIILSMKFTDDYGDLEIGDRQAW
jgi:hypothetical protein